MNITDDIYLGVLNLMTLNYRGNDYTCNRLLYSEPHYALIHTNPQEHANLWSANKFSLTQFFCLHFGLDFNAVCAFCVRFHNYI